MLFTLPSWRVLCFFWQKFGKNRIHAGKGRMQWEKVSFLIGARFSSGIFLTLKCKMVQTETIYSVKNSLKPYKHLSCQNFGIFECLTNVFTTWTRGGPFPLRTRLQLINMTTYTFWGNGLTKNTVSFWRHNTAACTCQKRDGVKEIMRITNW